MQGQKITEHKKTELEYRVALEELLELSMKSESVITPKERTEFTLDKLTTLFKENGEKRTEDSVISISKDNKEVLHLLPEGSVPLVIESSKDAFQISYKIDKLITDLLINKNHEDYITKTVSFFTKDESYVLGYRNINNSEFSTVITDLYP